MNAININNYEAWLLDFAEGNLSEEQQIELELFIIQHPELNINLSELLLLNIEANDVLFHDKQALKKSESDLVSETNLVAYIENQLSDEGKQTIDKSCANNKALAKELKLYQNTITHADATIIFPDKNKLKRQTKVIWFNFSATQYSIAASVLLLLGLYMFWSTQERGSNFQQISKRDNSVSSDMMPQNKPHTATLAENKEQDNISINEKQSAKTKSIISHQSIMVARGETKTQEELTNFSEAKNEIIEEENKDLLAINETKNSEIEMTPKTKTVVEVISESEEDIVAQEPKKKKSFWALAEKALQNLNAMGVKSVNANEESTEKDNASSYALTLGKVSVTHKSN